MTKNIMLEMLKIKKNISNEIMIIPHITIKPLVLLYRL